jgi:hypothetical protein
MNIKEKDIKDEAKIPNYVKRLRKYSHKRAEDDKNAPVMHIILEIRQIKDRDEIGYFRAMCSTEEEAKKILACLECAAERENIPQSHSYFLIQPFVSGELYMRPAEYDWISKHIDQYKN